MHILVVEDDHLLNNTLCYNLNAAGYKVDSALCKQEAGNYIEKQRYELIVLDVNLPDGNGFDLCREVKAIKPELPVIFLTANDLEQDVLSGFDLGAEDYITKPFNMQIFLRRVEVALRREEDLRFLLEPPERLAVDDPVTVPLEHRTDRVLLFGLHPAPAGIAECCPGGQGQPLDLFGALSYIHQEPSLSVFSPSSRTAQPIPMPRLRQV